MWECTHWGCMWIRFLENTNKDKVLRFVRHRNHNNWMNFLTAKYLVQRNDVDFWSFRFPEIAFTCVFSFEFFSDDFFSSISSAGSSFRFWSRDTVSPYSMLYHRLSFCHLKREFTCIGRCIVDSKNIFLGQKTKKG